MKNVIIDAEKISLAVLTSSVIVAGCCKNDDKKKEEEGVKSDSDDSKKVNSDLLKGKDEKSTKKGEEVKKEDVKTKSAKAGEKNPVGSDKSEMGSGTGAGAEGDETADMTGGAVPESSDEGGEEGGGEKANPVVSQEELKKIVCSQNAHYLIFKVVSTDDISFSFKGKTYVLNGYKELFLESYTNSSKPVLNFSVRYGNEEDVKNERLRKCRSVSIDGKGELVDFDKCQSVILSAFDSDYDEEDLLERGKKISDLVNETNFVNCIKKDGQKTFTTIDFLGGNVTIVKVTNADGLKKERSGRGVKK